MKQFGTMFLLLFMIPAVSHGQNYWMPVNNGLGTDSSVRAIVTARNGSLFMGMAEGILRSTNNGSLWEPLVPQGLITLQSLAVDPAGDVYGGTDHGMFLSTDNGATWTQINNNFPDSLVTTILVADSGVVYAGADVGGLHRTTDMGGHWTPVGGGITASDPNVMTMVGKDNIVLGMDGAGIFVSHNNGNTWLASDSGLTDMLTRAITATSSGAVFLGTNTDGVFRSLDTGRTWVPVNLGLTNTSVMSLLARPNGELFAGTGGGGVFRSVDNGAHWVDVNTGLGDFFVDALAADSSGYIYAGTNGGVFRSVSPMTAVTNDPFDLPGSVALWQNFPNPFNPATTIHYDLPVQSNVRLTVYNVLGEQVAGLVNGIESPGRRSASWNAASAPSGVYFYRLEAVGTKGRSNPVVQMRKMVLMK